MCKNTHKTRKMCKNTVFSHTSLPILLISFNPFKVTHKSLALTDPSLPILLNALIERFLITINRMGRVPTHPID